MEYIAEKLKINKDIYINSLENNSNEIYIYDTLTARILAFDEDETFKIRKVLNCKKNLYTRNNLISILGDSLFKDLIDNNVFVDRDQNINFEGNYDCAVIWLQSNHSCNLACPGCSTGMDLSQTTSKNMDKETLYKCLIKIADDSKIRGYKYINIRIGGGEPTLRGKQWLENIAEVSKKVEDISGIKISLSLLSNGILASKLFHETLKNNNIDCLISTDPSRVLPKVNIPTINIVLNNIKNLKEAGVEVAAQLTIGSHNVEDVIEIHKKLTDMGIRITWSLFRPNDMEQYSERCNPEIIIDAMKKIYDYTFQKIKQREYFGNISDFDYLGVGIVKDGVCGAGKNYIVLDYNGDIYTCTEKMKSENSKTQNILNTDKNVFDIIREIHEVPENLRYTKNIDIDYKFKWQSGAGCPWVVKKENDTYNAKSQYMTSVYEAIIPIMVSLNIEASKQNYL